MIPRPFTVIGGFLGAGKTTLVNRILGQSSGVRYAVLVNDFGAVNVDAGLIAAHDGQTMALTNGCICCSLADGFIATMLRLMAAPERFDHVIVEASGVAEPDRIMDFARLDPLLSPDAVLVLADAENLAARLADPHVGEVVARQIASADLLLLNRIDLTDAAALAAAEAELRRLNPRAQVLCCRHAALPLALLLGSGDAEARAAGGVPRHDHGPARPAFHTALVECHAPVDRTAFAAWEAALPGQILRGKGRVEIAGEGCFLWQRVGLRTELSPSPRPEPGTCLVLIGTRPIDAPPLPGGG